jgi:phytanoyl-CoA hydroxylase
MIHRRFGRVWERFRFADALPGEGKMAVEHKIDVEYAGTYAPELYKPVGVVPSIPSLDAFDDDAMQIYNTLGCVSVEQVLAPEQVRDTLDGLAHLLMGGSPDFKEVQYEARFAGRIDSLDAEQRMDAVRKLMFFAPYDHRLAAMAAYPPIMRIVEKILGERAKMFQDMALLKPPRGGREKPWHQDKAYFDLPLETKVVGVWIALDEATVENGCMHMRLGSHRQGPIVHFRRRDWQICDNDIVGKPCVVAPLKPGGLLLFDGLIHHGTPANRSAQRRRAVQFHYAAASTVETSKEERLKIFGEEGKNVTC